MGGHRASGAGDDLVDGPVDLAAVRADDALLDAIAGGAGRADRGADYGFGSGPVADDQADDERLAAVLAAWRADIEADPMPELVGLDEAVEAVTAGHEARDRVRSRARRRMPFAIAAAAAVVAVAGMTVAVHGSKPGDTLFGVSKVFFSEHAAEVQKVEDVRTSIERANEAITRGDRESARRELESANLGLPQLPTPDRAPLQDRRDEIQSSLKPVPPATSPSRSTSKSPDGSKRPSQRPAPGTADSADPRRDAGTGTPPQDPSDSSSTAPDPSPSDPATEPREVPVTPPASGTTTTTTPAPSSPSGGG